MVPGSSLWPLWSEVGRGGSRRSGRADRKRVRAKVTDRNHSPCGTAPAAKEFLMSRPRHIGLPWYAAEHYEALRQKLSDGGKLPIQYETWRVSTEQVEREVQRSGVNVVRVPIEPDTFMAWCADASLQPDGAARARYAAEALER